MINCFVDTEFTGFEVATQQLISLGIVSECGSYEFYVEVSNHNADFRSDFVTKTVIPLLDLSKYGKTYDWACLDLRDWVNTLPDERVNFIVDYSGDWNLLNPMLQKYSSNKQIAAEMYSAAFLRVLHERGVHTESRIDDAYRDLMYSDDSYYTQDPRQHHALVDAKANRHAFARGLKAGMK